MTAQHAYNLKIQAQGRVVVPADVRTELGVKEGDDLILLKDEGGYRLTSRRLLVRSLRGIVKKTGEAEGRDLTGELLGDRRAEAAQKGW
ncbi:AbrB/MazE/SpoVT family DNA-binding domain-containing protein [Deinococcus detaillensis]|uniref:AbrB/MazE/SpoVT family DNA-binding domain-containing protein n=1 Tax=Deinococcus detaillensis TaxID=2592048 RepID=A0A553UWW8_9DEIO|nr:AbrB/MazE/SpoVT family DNA-binding domain-containing protein [Deinococcus detaillensis]TSA84703.1 AbrB/MazE/SpoVT family DNA-binding domain-containing protein [Deinococcus detaillensis]